MMDVKLRKVTEEDKELIYRWANDSIVRANSFNSAPIPYAEHCIWFEKQLLDEQIAFYILEWKGVPLGQIRFQISGNTAKINYSIAQEYRGKGYGNAIISLGEERVANDFSNVDNFVAYVKKSNLPSAKVFKRLGYQETVADELTYEKKR